MISGLPIWRRNISDEEAAHLASVIHSPSGSSLEALILLSRWARQLSLSNKHQNRSIGATLPPQQQATLHAAVSAATAILKASSPADIHGAAAVLLLGNASTAIQSQPLLENIVETVGSALLSWHAQNSLNGDGAHFLPTDAAELLIPGVSSLLPLAMFSPDAACWLFTALLSDLSLLSTCNPPPTTTAAASALFSDDCSISIENLAVLASLYPSIRTTTLSLLEKSDPISLQAGFKCLESMYGSLRAVLLPYKGSFPGDRVPGLPMEAQASAAVLACGGILEGLARAATANSNLNLHRSSVARTFPIGPLIEGLSDLLHTVAKSKYSGVFLRAATGLIVAQTWSSCRLPKPSPGSLLSCTTALFEGCLSIDPLLKILQQEPMRQDPGKTSAALAEQAQQGLAQHAPALTAMLLSHVTELQRQLGPEDRIIVLEIVEKSAYRTHQDYRCYIVDGYAQHAAGVDHRPLQALLEKLFTTSMEVLAALSAPSIASNHAVSIVRIAADLHFCRSPNSPHYANVLKSAINFLPNDAIASAHVAAALPPYDLFTNPVVAYNNAPVWLVDGVVAAKIQLLFTALLPCCDALKESIVLDSIAPLAFLYVLHPHTGTSNAAHALLWGIMAARPQHAQQLVPYYTTRCLKSIPGSSSAGPAATSQQQHFSKLSQGLSAAFNVLGGGSAVPVLCVKRVLGKCRELVIAGSCWDETCVALYTVATQQLLTVHYSLVEAITQEIHGFVAECPQRLKNRLCEGAVAVVAGTDDCVRKPKLANWYQQLAASLY